MTEELNRLLMEVGKYVHPEKERTLFSLGGRGYYENPTSDILAYFLDPAADHGLGSLFLQAFLDCMNVPTETLLLGQATVQREKQTNGNGFIDLYLRGTGWVLLIENKIRHCQVNPFDDYEATGREWARDSKLLMAILSPDGKVIPNNWIGVSYKSYCRALRRSLSESLFNHRYSKWVIFAREFILHLENELYQPIMNKNQVDFVERHVEQIAQLKDLETEYRQFLLNLLKSQLEASLQGHAFKTKDDGWGIRCFSDKWGSSNNLVLALPSAERDWKMYACIYLINLPSAEFEARSIEVLQGTEQMQFNWEGKWLRFVGANNFENHESAINKLCKLGLILDNILQA
jgi:hypothetical protein